MQRAVAIALLALAGAVGTWGQAASAIWLDVPFVAQPREGCGAASIAMVMQYWAAQKKSEAAKSEPILPEPIEVPKAAPAPPKVKAPMDDGE